MMGSECSMFFILFYFKKISQLNVAIMTLNDIMRKNPYFGFMQINAHDLFH
jgi:hypothetical protein